MPQKSKTVGLITFHRTSNFGSQLQALGLYRAICNLGANCEIVDYRCEAIEAREFRAQRMPVQSPKSLLKKLILEPALRRKARNMVRFLRANAKLSPRYTRETIHSCADGYDKLIVGSDIVWGLDITQNDLTYFLDFAANTKKYAFASSVGTLEPPQSDSAIPILLADFRRICVREREAIRWVKQAAGKDADLVCDPTMLLTIEEWEAIVTPKEYKKGYVLVYFEDPNGKMFADASRYAKEHGLSLRYITYMIPPKDVVWERPTRMEEFIGLIKHASAVFTASYHGLLFSLYYERDVYFYNRAHRSRMASLAETLGIEDRCADVEMPERPIDYGAVGRKIAAFRADSISYLQDIFCDEAHGECADDGWRFVSNG